MSFQVRVAINNVEVQEGAEITDLVTEHHVLGRVIKVGAVCEGLEPESWRSIITANGRRVWTANEAMKSYDEANRFARQRHGSSVERALRELFAD